MKSIIKEIEEIYDKCESDKIAAFETALKHGDLEEWSRTADKYELVAYQKIKELLRARRRQKWSA